MGDAVEDQLGVEPSQARVRPQVWYVTVRYPVGHGEEFLGPEIQALRAHADVTVVPLRPPARAREGSDLIAEPLLSLSVLASAATTMLRHPITLLSAIGAVTTRTSMRNALRNLLVVPKAIWIARRVPTGAHLHAAWASTPASTCLVAGRLTRAAWSFTAHRHDLEAANLLGRKVSEAAFARAIADVGRVQLSDLAGPGSRVETIHVGVALPPPAPVRVADGTVTVLAAASLIPRKNHLTMVRALSHPAAARVRLVLAGDGPERGAIEALATELRVSDRLTMCGRLEHEKVLELLESGTIDVASLASESEGIPVSLMEALARGVPVVASRVGGVEELVGPGAGILIDDRSDAAAFATAWAEVGSWDPSQAAARARVSIRDGFDVATTAASLFDLMFPGPG